MANTLELQWNIAATPWGTTFWPLLRGVHKLFVWDLGSWPLYRGGLYSGVAVKRGSTAGGSGNNQSLVADHNSLTSTLEDVLVTVLRTLQLNSTAQKRIFQAL